MNDEPIFRASKRRRVFRKRDDEDDAPALPPAAGPATAEQPSNPTSDDAHPVSEMIRRRRLLSSRRGGIEFSNTPRAGDVQSLAPEAGAPVAIVVERPDVLEAAARRFAPQTGQVTESNDGLMAAFVDSELARMRGGLPVQTGRQYEVEVNGTTTVDLGKGGADVKVPPRQPAAQGKIFEIDLGPDSALRNAARTEAAARRMAGEEAVLDGEGLVGKVRLGRDGRPRRRRNRRGSDDVRRDEIVEAVLRESRLDLYEPPSPPPISGSTTADADGAADDALAEQFRREFMDALQTRNQARPKAAAQGAGGAKGKVEEKAKGPKLGGSRSARAAMHALEKAKGGAR